MKYLFLDTNIYLHYLHFEEIDWKKMIGGADFSIVIPPIVIREIDEKKDSGKGNVKKKAKKISSLFGEVFLYKKPLKVNVFKGKEAESKQFKASKFNEKIADDWFILSVINSNYPLEDKIVISADNNLLIKADENELKFIKISESLRLKEVETDEEKENKSKLKELELLKNRKSKPEITFADGSILLKLKHPELKDLEVEVAKLVAIEKQRLPFLNGEIGNMNSLDFQNYNEVFGFDAPEPHHWRMYNIELEKYFKAYESFERQNQNVKNLDSYFQKIKFRFQNGGTAQTGLIDLFLEFPDSIEVFNSESKEEFTLPDIPKAPTGAQIMSKYSNNYSYLPIDSRTVDVWDRTKTISNEIHTQIQPTNHNIQFVISSIDTTIFMLDCKNFSIDWSIIDASHIEPIEGKLNVVFE